MKITVNVQNIKSLGRGRYKVKLAETRANLTDMRHKDEEYVVTKNLGRGRYVMRKSI